MDEFPGVDGLDRLLEHRTRLGACVLLARHDAMTFRLLRDLLDETDGNLGANLGKLEGAGYVVASKEYEARKPVTWYSLTPDGRRALVAHLDALAELANHARRTI
ncbi:MAG: transcriptional regulator [Gemmatimonadetes bacterium]|nr:transcriptional regulator [Gemmatimonadota bacterium]